MNLSPFHNVYTYEKVMIMTHEQFTTLLTECKNAIKRFVYYKTPSKADGDDVLQETLLAAYTRRDSLHQPEKFKAWLLSIAANKCNDFYRKRATLPEWLPDSDHALDNALQQTHYGLTIADTVQEALLLLGENDAALLRLVYIERYKLAEVAAMLDIPIGTVKSRLFAAKRRFKDAYPFTFSHKKSKGAKTMKKLPETLPEYTFTESTDAPFPVKWEEKPGWFIVPRLGEKISWGIYDWPEKKRTSLVEMEVTFRTTVHGVEGVEIVACENYKGTNYTRTFVEQLTDTHVRTLAETVQEGDEKLILTFLDEDNKFVQKWGFGEDNCGKEVNIAPKGIIKRDGNTITAPLPLQASAMDVVGRYTVNICGKEYDCVCLINAYTHKTGILTEQFIDANGRTVLWRRFNHNNWSNSTYKQLWTEKLPDSQRYTVNGEIYVHWYDCISDYIL